MEFQKDELNDILNIFQQESSEIISSMDDKLLKLETSSKDPSLAIQLFRDAHSLKGSARMLGFDEIQDIAHKIEDIISLVKEGKITITSKITDVISECLEFISTLINKTCEQKKEYKSPLTREYIEKLQNVKQESLENSDVEIIVSTDDVFKKEIINNLDKVENYIVEILYIISYARENKDYSNIGEIENKANAFLLLFSQTVDEQLDSFKNSIRNILVSLDKFKNSDNKEYSFLDVNNNIVSFVERLSNYFDVEKIKRKNYYEIVDGMLVENVEIIKTNVEESFENQKNPAKETKYGEILRILPLLEVNCEFFKEFVLVIDILSKEAPNHLVEFVFHKIKDTVGIYQDKNIPLTRDVVLGIKEAIEAISGGDEDLIKETLTKMDLIKTMANFQHNRAPKKNRSTLEQTQKEILNTITNTEIKTLRVDSSKLDNLVGQIGELIVSKIKTNEQLSLAKKINNDMLDWQKNFIKMNYYVKYFDKKYLSNPIDNSIKDFRKIFAYNKQLCTLCEQHQEKINSLMKEMSNLFKQIQESETKLNSTTTEIETMVKNMRILPLSTIFQLFPRMVHNIARDKNKKIDLIINGADVTADKTIIEELKIPLMHIIRNSIDHGIEDVETRKKFGKNPVGKIEINASYKDDRVIVDVKDDGRGLDIEKIKAKALEKNLLTQDEINSINDEELTNLIFYPGFSTEDFVTELSGRGLGLDIVNNKISHLQGRVDIFSQLNQGTVVRIILPATVATKKVFIIEEQKQLYAIETSVIKTIARINSDEIFEKDGDNYYIYGGNAILVHTLSQILNFENTERDTNKYTLLIIETDNTTFGVIVEKLVSDQEIVHKKLAPPLYKVKNISGITTLANGEACLILNVSDIIQIINSRKIKGKIISKNSISKTRNNFKYKILILDDSHTTRILQKNILSNYGYNITTASNPLNALDKSKQIKFDLIISDIQMPEMNGFEFIDELRKIKDYENTPVIVVSSESKEKYITEIEKTKVTAYIQKNVFKQEELIECIESNLAVVEA